MNKWKVVCMFAPLIMAGSAIAQEGSVVLDCTKDVIKVDESGQFYYWSDLSRLYSGGDRRWLLWSGQEACTDVPEGGGARPAQFSVTPEVYAAKCVQWNSVGKTRMESVSINRIDGTARFVTHFEGNSPRIVTSVCVKINDPETVPPPAAKF